MGERGANNEEATPEDIEAMAGLVKEGLEAGALGFSSSRTLGHRAKGGDYVPGTFADDPELLGICRMLGEVGHGVFEVATGALIGGDVATASGMPPEEEELARLRRLAKEIGRPVTFACVQNSHDTDQWKRLLTAAEEAAADGERLVPQVLQRPPGFLMSFDSSHHPFRLNPSFQPLRDLSPEARRAELRKPEVRKRLLSETPDLTDHPAVYAYIFSDFSLMFPLGDPPEYEPPPEQSLAAMEEREGRDPKELVYDMMLDGELLYLPVIGYAEGDLETLRAMMQHERTLFGLADGGAHSGLICDASAPTYLLTHWVRDRTRGERLPLEWVVERQTRATARFYGMDDRGVVASGMLADLNIIDFQGLRLQVPEMIYDLPGNERRLVQQADGYRYTIKRGEVTYEDGKPTGKLPGLLIRGPQAAPAG